MVWAARGSGNLARPFTSKQACLGAPLCAPAPPADRSRAGKLAMQRQREVTYSRSRGEGSELGRGLPKMIYFLYFFF